MSRINGSADTTFPMLVFLCGLIGYLLVDFIRRRRPHKDRKVPLTRGRIIYLAWGADAVRMAVLTVLLCILPVVAFLYERIGVGGLVGSICVVLVITCIPILSRMRWIWYAMPLILGKRRIPLPEHAELENTDGTWFYQDKDWYIRMGRDTCALLYAPHINFELPSAVFWVSSETALKGSAYIHCLHFEEKGGGTRRVLHCKDERIRQWVQRHNGRFL